MSEVKRPEFPTICFETDTQEAMRQADAYMDHLEAEKNSIGRTMEDAIDRVAELEAKNQRLREAIEGALEQFGGGEDIAKTILSAALTEQGENE